MNNMKTLNGMNRAAAVLVSTVLGAVSFCNCFQAWAADEGSEPLMINVVFDVEEGTDYAVGTEASDFDSYQIDVTDVNRLRLPSGKLKKSGEVFSGWTVDGLYGYEIGGVYLIPEGTTEDIHFKPCFYKNVAGVQTYKINYHVIIDGEEMDLSERVEKTTGRPGQLVLPDYTRFTFDNCSSRGWTDGTNVFDNGQYIVMPDHDIDLTGLIQQNVRYTYLAGDVEGIRGMTEFESPVFIEGFPNELCAKDRFSRDGYTIVGWKSSLDGEVYKPLQTVITPNQNVTFTAVWEPVTYPVKFNTLDSSIESPIINAKTGETIIIPELEATREGYTFSGWKNSRSSVIYQPGEEFVIPPLMSGQKQSFNAVWTVGSAEPATQPPTEAETQAPTETETQAPTETETQAPTETETQAPTETETQAPTETETQVPTETETQAPTETETQVPTDGDVSKLSGDSNLDGKITVADAVGVLQHIANQDKYGLKGQALINADCDGVEGLTGGDATAIQKKDAGLVAELPLKPEK